MCSDTTRTQDTVCAFPNCISKVWQDPDGSFSSFCGLTHRDAMATQINQTALPTCKNCQERPVYVENGRIHDFCGRRCASNTSNVTNTAITRSPSVSASSAVCRTSSCNLPVYVGADGTASQWCSHRHREQALRDGSTEACLFCRKFPKALVNNEMSEYCSRKCGQAAMSLAPAILPIKNEYEGFKDVNKQFIDSWKHQTRIPTVIKIWRILGLKTLLDDFSRYKLSIERKRNIPGGNSRRRWHGTVRACRLGDDDSQRTLCTNRSCSLCRIIESSFKLAQFGQRTNYGRFGAGIYTSATSSKANDYVSEQGASPYRSMLLNDVVIGNAIKLFTDNSSLREPPAGYDSVIGEPGHSLNYDEAIVYKNEAIRPLFLIIYQ